MTSARRVSRTYARTYALIHMRLIVSEEEQNKRGKMITTPELSVYRVGNKKAAIACYTMCIDLAARKPSPARAGMRFKQQ